MDDFVYILIEREFIKCKESVYKIGRTKDIRKRFQAYPKGSKLLVSSIVPDSKFVENQIIKTFKQKFKQRTDIGTEYFEGMFVEMQNEFNNIVNSVEVPNPKQEYTFAEFESCTLNTHPRGEVSERPGVNQASECSNPRATNLKRPPAHAMKGHQLKCDCGFQTNRAFNLQRHMVSSQHAANLKLLQDILVANERGDYECIACNYSSTRKSNYRKHILSKRHQDITTSQSKKKKEVEEQTLKTDLKPVMLVEVMDMFFKFHESTLEKQKIQDTEMFKGLMDRMFCYQQQQIQQLHPVQK